MESLPYTIREINRLTDSAFVYSSWLRSGLNAKPPALARSTYFQEQHRVITALFDAAAGIRLAAVANDDADQVFGWLFGGPGRLDYVYVKPIYRKLGLATALLARLGPVAQYTHLGNLAPLGAAYNPYLLFNLPSAAS